MRDGLTVCHVPAFAVCVEVDMGQSKNLLAAAKSAGTRLTYAHLFVRAAAVALSGMPDLHRLVCGNRSHQPGNVDIALSVAGDAAVAPVLIVEKADQKPVTRIADEVVRRTPEVIEKDKAFGRALDTWGRLIPFGFARRALLRLCSRSVRFRRKGSGTFQVSVLRGVDSASSSVFGGTAMLAAGSVREKAVVADGRIVVRPCVTLTCCADHRVWDGRAGQRFLEKVKSVLEGSQLHAEFAAARWEKSVRAHAASIV